MKRYATLFIFLIMVTVGFRNGTTVKYSWADNYKLISYWNKPFYVVYWHDWQNCRTIYIPENNVLTIEKD
jgi:hypothetical protein